MHVQDYTIKKKLACNALYMFLFTGTPTRWYTGNISTFEILVNIFTKRKSWNKIHVRIGIWFSRDMFSSEFHIRFFFTWNSHEKYYVRFIWIVFHVNCRRDNFELYQQSFSRLCLVASFDLNLFKVCKCKFWNF